MKRTIANRTFNCDQCDFTAASDPSLKKHKKEKHTKIKIVTNVNKRKCFCTEGKEGGEEKMDIDDSDKISKQTDNVERILDAKEEELFPDDPEMNHILRMN